MQDIAGVLNGLSEIEKQQVISILEDMKSGKNNTYQNLINDVWDEVPVDIDTFIEGTDAYIGYSYRLRNYKDYKDPFMSVLNSLENFSLSL